MNTSDSSVGVRLPAEDQVGSIRKLEVVSPKTRSQSKKNVAIEAEMKLPESRHVKASENTRNTVERGRTSNRHVSRDDDRRVSSRPRHRNIRHEPRDYSPSQSELSYDSSDSSQSPEPRNRRGRLSSKKTDAVKVHRSLFRGGQFSISDVLLNLERLRASTFLNAFCSVASFFFLIGANHYRSQSSGILVAMFLNLLGAAFSLMLHFSEGWQHYAAVSKMYRIAEKLRVNELKKNTKNTLDVINAPIQGALTHLQLYQQNFLHRSEFQLFYGWTRHLQMHQTVLALPVAVATIFFTVYGMVDGIDVISFWSMNIGEQFMYMLLIITSGIAILAGSVFSWLLNRFDYRSIMLFLNETSDNQPDESIRENNQLQQIIVDLPLKAITNQPSGAAAAAAAVAVIESLSHHSNKHDNAADYDVSDDESSLQAKI